MSKRLKVLAGIAALALVAAPGLEAQPYAIPWSSVDGGGAIGASGGSYTLAGTIGQADASGALTGGSYSVQGGFWAGVTPFLPSLAITSVLASEGNSGTTPAGFTVSLTAGALDPVTVSFQTSNGTATAPADYLSSSGALSFAPGETSKPVAVSVVGDLLDEADETFLVTLSSALNATLGTAVGTGTIVDDDLPPALAVNDVAVAEGNSGSAPAHFTVALDAPSGKTVTVDYQTADGSPGFEWRVLGGEAAEVFVEAATAGSDYVSTFGALTFSPGQTAKVVSVSVLGDTQVEPDETYLLQVLNPLNASLGKASGTGRIGNDDGPGLGPRISVDDRQVAEGNALNASLRVVLSEPVSSPVTVEYTTAWGTALSPDDYATTSGVLSFSPGRTTHSIAVPIVTDTTAEGNEEFYVNLANPTNAALLDGQAVGTITDPPTPANTRMFRAYNPNADYHFFTTAFPEFANAVAAGYNDESSGRSGFCVPNTQGTGKAGIFRMYNPNSGRHYYSTSGGERDFLKGIGWVYEKDEGAIFTLAGGGTTEIFKLYNNNSGVHLYTEDAGMKDAILSIFAGIWAQHSSMGFAFLSPTNGSCP